MDPPAASDISATATIIFHHSPDAAMARMKEDFQSILISISPVVRNRIDGDLSSTFTDSEYSSYSQYEGMNSNTEVIDNQAIHNLRSIAKRMISAGYSRDCIEAYTNLRKTGIDERFKKHFRIERMSSMNIQRLQWDIQKEYIQRWISTAKICIRSLFASEKRLSEQIFKGLGTDNHIDDACFMEIVKDSASELFNFVEAISGSRKSPEKLFKILDLYEVLSDLFPDIETIFGSKSGQFIRKQAVEILFNLSEAAREMLSEFEKAVFGEISKVRIPGGSIHPLTTYVMDYILDIVEHNQTLSQLIMSKPSSLDCIRTSDLDFDFSEFEGEASPLLLHLVWIVVVLKFTLQRKSKQYKGASLARLFIMNNVHHIVQEIRGSFQLRQMIGDDYQSKLINLAQANYYQKSNRRRMLNWFVCDCCCFHF